MTVYRQANIALGHADLGIIVLPTVIEYSRVLARLALGLDRQPELIVHLPREQRGEEDSETLPQKAINIMRAGFNACLNDRNGPATGIEHGRPYGKKVGIYTIANLCLKVLNRVGGERNAEQIFNNIHQQSPPLSIYPLFERVTYLYYLGLFHFSYSHYYRANLCLQAAYDQCPPDVRFLKQRRLILIYLIASNMIHGRFPSETLYRRSEAYGLRERFRPLCAAMKKGDLETFHRLTDVETEHFQWFLKYKMFFAIKNRCEIVVWRSLTRRVFILVGEQGDVTSRKAPTLDLRFLEQAFRMLEIRTYWPLDQLSSGPGLSHTNHVLIDTSVPPPNAGYVDPDFDGLSEEDETFDRSKIEPILPDMREIECIVAGLIRQGFLNGYISSTLR